MNSIRYPAKILLFGEYIIIKNAQALAMPFEGFAAEWQLQAEEPPSKTLLEFASYLNDKAGDLLPFNIDTGAFSEELKNGLRLHSTIPQGYGVGSSGAVCAAVFDRFGNGGNEKEIPGLKQLFSQMESFFHGSSSGADPLVCYLRQALLIDPAALKSIRPTALPALSIDSPATLFLLDTRLPRNTRQLVDTFLKDCEQAEYLARIQAELMAHSENAIHALLHANWAVLFELFHEISYFQFRYMSKMIPETIRGIWLEGLSNELYKLKLCGAGGGGFMLGMTNDWAALQKELTAFPLLRINNFKQ